MRALGVLVAACVTVVCSSPLLALAATGAGSGGSFSVVPVSPPGGQSYFQYHLNPGGAAHGAVAVVGEPTRAVHLSVFAAEGVTAIGSGDAYLAPPPGRCTGAACWISDLPGQLTVPSGQRVEVDFAVKVPPGTPAGQYLAGVGVAEVAPSTTTTTPAPTKGRSAVTHIARQVVVGVEVTVGSDYPDVVDLDKVTGTRIGNSAGVVVDMANTGKTIEHPDGVVTVGKGHAARSFRFVSGTVLAGGSAGLRVLTSGLQPGSYPSSAYLRYGGGDKVARWSGTISIPAAAPSKPISIPAHGRVVVVSTGVPSWLVAVIVGVGALLVVAVVVLLVVLQRTRRRRAGVPGDSEA